jgi:hypothetical protein
VLEVSRVVGVGALGGTSGNFQSRARTISFQAAVFPGALANGSQQKKKKKNKKIMMMIVMTNHFIKQ